MKWLQFWRNAEKARHSRAIIDPTQVTPYARTQYVWVSSSDGERLVNVEIVHRFDDQIYLELGLCRAKDVGAMQKALRIASRIAKRWERARKMSLTGGEGHG